MTNGAEAVFCMMAFFYYFKLKYVSYNEDKQKSAIKYIKFDRNMALMTFAITISFLVRSSSLIGWLPLISI
jgi:hypothetical protein